MGDLEVFVIRVYRKDAVELAGVVEQVDGGQEKAFRDATELWRALADFISFGASLESKPNQENER